MAAIRAVLFDLDGTLIDSAPDLAGAGNDMRLARGLEPLPYEHFRPMVGSGARGMVGIALQVGPLDAGFTELRDEFLARYEQRMTQLTYAFDGVPELIGQLDRLGLPWGVVTNKSMRFTGPLTRGMPLFATARALVGGDSTPHAKPHPEPLFEAARQLGLDPRRCIYVGDDERDVVAGLAAGMGTVAATYGYLGSNADTSRWGAHAHIHSPLELMTLLQLATSA